jgi:UDP-N-acetylmuramoylalanine--D-glutamate ligase
MKLGRDWKGKRVTVVGLGIEGEDMARYFAGLGARVTVSDAKTREALGQRAAALEAEGVRLALGGNDPADTVDADLVCVSQSVPLSNPAVAAAIAAGRPVESMTSLFLQWWPGPVLGITGSSGKTTTTSLTGAVFAAAGRPHVLGGNIGVGLLSLLGQGRPPETWAVMEISHTQLVLTRQSPGVAALLNVTPNHLDQFTWEEYVELKRRIFSFQGPRDVCVFNAEDPVSRDLRGSAPGRSLLFGTGGDHGCDGAFVEDGALFMRLDGRATAVLPAVEVPLRGRHNLANVAAAAALAVASGIGPKAVAAAVRGFRAPPHRIEPVGSVDGAAYYDDSIATTPERTLAALRSFEEPIVLLLGGRDKHLPLDQLAAEAGRRCRAIVCFGEARVLLAEATRRSGCPVEVVDDLPAAVDAAHRWARAGDVVLLSPACTSFDAYANFERRGEHFRELVRALQSGGKGATA